MAQITCPECLAQVDEEESFCPNCGHLLVDAEDDEVRYYAEEKKWTFGNTLIALLLALLIAALGIFLYLNGLKWPYEDATKYYTDEKNAYEQQVREYQAIPEKISAANSVLDARIDQLRAVLNSGEEPMDPKTAATANEVIQKALQQRAEVPVIEAGPAPSPDKDSIFHAKEVRETGRVIDQLRYSLYQQYGGLQVPDYTAALDALDRAEERLRASIELRKQSEKASPELKKLLEDYQTFMDEYIQFMTTYDRGERGQIEHAAQLQTQYVEFRNQIRAVDVSKLSEIDASYFTMMTESINQRLRSRGLTEPELDF